MTSVSAIQKRVQPFQNKWLLIEPQQNTTDIIKLLLQEHSKNAADYDKISEMFWSGNSLDTAKKLFDFCKQNITYKIEPDTIQTVKSPASILHHKYGDCKHYASFICGVLDSLKRKGYPVDCRYRFASYRSFDKEPHHVFAVLKYKGADIWVDPVLKYFNERKPYYYSKDKNPSKMLYSIHGVEDAIGKKNPAKKQERQAERKRVKALPKKERRKVRTQKLKHTLKKFNVPLVTARNSYLLLCKMNLFRIASKVGKKMQERPQFRADLKKTWEGLGGNYDKLRQAINQGINVWNKHHKDKIKHISGSDLNEYGWDPQIQGFYVHGVGYIDMEISRGISGYGTEGYYLGVAPAAAGVVAIIAAALPVIAKLASMFKRNGIDTSDMTKEGAASAEDLADTLQESAEILETTGAKDAVQDGTGVDGNTPKMYAKTKVNADGSTELNIEGSTYDNSDGGAAEPIKKGQLVKGGGSGAKDDGSTSPLADFKETISNFWSQYKKPILWGGGALLALSVAKPLVQNITAPTKRRR